MNTFYFAERNSLYSSSSGGTWRIWSESYLILFIRIDVSWKVVLLVTLAQDAKRLVTVVLSLSLADGCFSLLSPVISISSIIIVHVFWKFWDFGRLCQICQRSWQCDVPFETDVSMLTLPGRYAWHRVTIRPWDDMALSWLCRSSASLRPRWPSALEPKNTWML